MLRLRGECCQYFAFPFLPARGECSLPPASIHGIVVIVFPMNQISSRREEEVVLVYPLLSFHKRGKTLPAKRIFLPSAPI